MNRPETSVDGLTLDSSIGAIQETAVQARPPSRVDPTSSVRENGEHGLCRIAGARFAMRSKRRQSEMGSFANVPWISPGSPTTRGGSRGGVIDRLQGARDIFRSVCGISPTAAHQQRESAVRRHLRHACRSRRSGWRRSREYPTTSSVRGHASLKPCARRELQRIRLAGLLLSP
jgi:hypothetical protein